MKRTNPIECFACSFTLSSLGVPVLKHSSGIIALASSSASNLDGAAVGSPSIFFQIVLTLSLLGIGLYAVALRRRIAALGNTAALVTMAAMVLVWRPDYATHIAKMVGVGRGVDLIFYCWVIISLVMILNLHFRIRSQTEQMTELVRRMTLDHPVSPGGNSNDETRMTNQ